LLCTIPDDWLVNVRAVGTAAPESPPQLVVLGNLERYFKFMGKFRTMGPLRLAWRRG